MPLSFKENTNVNREGLTIHRYPSDVGSDEYPNYIMFNIIKRTGDIGNEVADKAQQKPFREESSKQIRYDNNPEAGAAALSIGAGTGAAFGVGKAINETGAAVRGAVAAVSPEVARATTAASGAAALTAGAVVGLAVAGGAAASKTATNRDKVLLKTTIALHLNNKPSVSYKAQWADTELGILGGSGAALSKAKDAESLLAGAGSLLSDAGGAAMSAGLRNAAETPLNNLGDIRGFAESNLGQAINPFKAQLFKNMEFRTFSFDYVFLPRNQEEYDSVQKIIKTFKRYMHPNFGPPAFFMGYPAEFNIAYFHKAGANYENIFKLSSCALTDLKVEYGGADFVTFKGTNGAPTEIALSLSFLELELLTQARVEEGY